METSKILPDRQYDQALLFQEKRSLSKSSEDIITPLLHVDKLPIWFYEFFSFFSKFI